jgi:hypothetical protein
MDTTKILKEKNLNSSVVAAGLSIGVHPSVIELFLPAMLEATKTIYEQEKIKRNRESLSEGIFFAKNA